MLAFRREERIRCWRTASIQASSLLYSQRHSLQLLLLAKLNAVVERLARNPILHIYVLMLPSDFFRLQRQIRKSLPRSVSQLDDDVLKLFLSQINIFFCIFYGASSGNPRCRSARRANIDWEQAASIDCRHAVRQRISVNVTPSILTDRLALVLRLLALLIGLIRPT